MEPFENVKKLSLYKRKEQASINYMLLIGTYLSSRYCVKVLSNLFCRLKDDFSFILFFY